MRVQLFNKYVGCLPLNKQIDCLKRGYKITINTEKDTDWSNKVLLFIKFDKNKNIIFACDINNDDIYKIDVTVPYDYKIKLIDLPNF